MAPELVAAKAIREQQEITDLDSDSALTVAPGHCGSGRARNCIQGHVNGWVMEPGLSILFTQLMQRVPGGKWG